MTVAEAPMDQIKKFLFDVSFDEDDFAQNETGSNTAAEETAGVEDQEPAAPTFTEQEVEAAKRNAFETGKEEGIHNAADAIEKRISETLEILCNRFQILFDQQKIANAQIFDDATNTAVAITRKCFPHLTSSEALKAIENMVRKVLSELLEEPNVTIHLNKNLIEPINDRITQIAKDANFTGQILVVEDTSLAPGDCQMTWGNGSAERILGALLQLTDDIVAQNLSAASQDIGVSATESSKASEASESVHSVEDTTSLNQSQDAEGAESIQASGDLAPGSEISNTTPSAEYGKNSSFNNNVLEQTNSKQMGPNTPQEEAKNLVGASEAAVEDIDNSEADLPGEPESVNKPIQDGILEAAEHVESPSEQPNTADIDTAEESTPLAKPDP